MSIFHGGDSTALHRAAQQLARGELVAFPTETVYGLGARADDDAAVAGIFAAKGRPADHPLIVHVHSLDAVHSFAADVCPTAHRLMTAFWPGPLTLILPRRPGQGTAAAAGQDSIGLRMPAHPIAQALLQAAAQLGVAGVAAPSANRFGRVSPTLANHVAHEFGAGLTVIDGGACDVGIESAIVDCSRGQPTLLRPGQLSCAQIEAVLGTRLLAPDAASPRAPGTLTSHYAPAAPVHLFSGRLPDDALDRAAKANQVLGVYSRDVPSSGSGPGMRRRLVHQPMPLSAAAVAHDLFAVLRDFDAAGVSAIWVERPPPGPEWDGVRDRLQRAAASTASEVPARYAPHTSNQASADPEQR
jgi:L-threonylcarbamoyladenylate synthase